MQELITSEINIFDEKHHLNLFANDALLRLYIMTTRFTRCTLSERIFIQSYTIISIRTDKQKKTNEVMNNNSTNDDDQFHQQQQETIMSFPGNSNKINHLYKVSYLLNYFTKTHFIIFLDFSCWRLCCREN